MWWIWAIVILVLGSMAYAAAKGAPWVPTWKHDIDRLHRLLDLREGDRFYELGCGDGRVVTRVAARSRAHGVGIELSFLQWLAAKIRAFFSRHKPVIKFGNVFHHDLSDADAVYLFLMPDTYQKLRPKFEAELRPGTKVVTYVWPIEGWEPTHVDEHEGKPKLYLYTR